MPGGQTASESEGPGFGTSCTGYAYLLWVGHSKGHEGIHGHHPWGYGGSKTLPEERPKRDILPLLNVSSYRRRGGGLTNADRVLCQVPPCLDRGAQMLSTASPPSLVLGPQPGWQPKVQGHRCFEVAVPGCSKEKDGPRAGSTASSPEGAGSSSLYLR